MFTCPMPGCEKNTAYAAFMCRDHWTMVPADDRIQIRMETTGTAARTERLREAIRLVSEKLAAGETAGDS